MKCCFCRLAKHKEFPDALHTELFYEDEYVIIVEDDHPKGYEMRLLCVWKEHVAVGKLAGWQIQYMFNVLMKTTLRVNRERGLVMAKLDTTEHRITSHEHWQMCMDLRKGGVI